MKPSKWWVTGGGADIDLTSAPDLTSQVTFKPGRATSVGPTVAMSSSAGHNESKHASCHGKNARNIDATAAQCQLRLAHSSGRAQAKEEAEAAEPGSTAVSNWETKFQELKDFMRDKGHDCVPNATHERLAAWISRQRHERKCEKLTADRARRLDAIGFHWSSKLAREHMAMTEAGGDTRADGLERRVEEHPCHGARSSEQAGRTPLGGGGGGDASVTKIDATAAECQLCFTHSDAEAKWNDNYSKLKEYALLHGHACPPAQEPELGWWARSQRTLYKEGRLEESQAAMLSAVGFIFDGAQACHMRNSLAAKKSAT